MFYDTWNCGRLLYALYLIFYNESDTNVDYLKQSIDKCGAIGHKLLQFLLMHDGFLSEECKKKFDHVFENCDTHSWENTLQMYFDDFGEDIEDTYIITEESKIPTGSGSIGQVYKLYHKELGKYVALKIKHPNIDAEATRFVRNVTYMLSIVEYVKRIPFSLLIKEFLNNIHIQLDYTLEAKNTMKMRDNFKNEQHIIIPEVYDSTDRIIVMSYYDGVPYTELVTNEKTKNYIHKISFDMYMFMLSSMLVYDFIHCDLHYGNWKVVIDPEYKIIIYDCGIVGSTGNSHINKDIILSLFDGDYTNLINVLIPDLEKQKNGKILKEYVKTIREKDYKQSSERFADFLKKALLLGIEVNKGLLRCVQGVIMCMSFTALAIDKVTKTVGKKGNRKEVILSYNHEALKRLQIYSPLCEYFGKWKEDDPILHTKFLEWMEDTIGHKDIDVFMEVTMKQYFKDTLSG